MNALKYILFQTFFYLILTPYTILAGSNNNLADKVFQWVAKNGDTDTVLFFLHKNSLSSLALDLSHALEVASEKDYDTLYRLFFSYIKNPLEAYKNASRTGDIHTMKFIITQSNAIDPDLSLFKEAQHGRAAIMQLLLDNGAQVNKAFNGYTPLSIAAYCGHTEAVQLLIQHGAAVDGIDITVPSPLEEATEQGHIDVMQLLLKRGADMDAEDGTYNPLTIASEKGNAQALKLLLQYCKEPIPQPSIQILYNLASKNGHASVVELLLKHCATPKKDSFILQTPLLLASENGHASVVKLLLESGARPDIHNPSLQTPLILAAANGHTKTVQLLLEHGADKDAEDIHHIKASVAADYNGHRDLANNIDSWAQDPQESIKNPNPSEDFYDILSASIQDKSQKR